MNEKKDNSFSIKEVTGLVQHEVQSILIDCPKCDSPKTKITGKKSYFGAIGSLIYGAFAFFPKPISIAIKAIPHALTSKSDRVYKMFGKELWNFYVVWAKCWVIVFTFGIINTTKTYKCEKCGKTWVV